MCHDEESTVVLHKIIAQKGDEVKEGDVLCVFLRKENEEEKEDVKLKDDDEYELLTPERVREILEGDDNNK
eukprot:CAMPEP_0194152336 /NCGR_PEP_ID=MMETSP0152-20130528/51845_1 /TAXON_ID=1049557 /ORGANISM="Thalassiothrix antarctica, Strain L6-D1" /LENGTH=70 /DNA_ID=CAMNT_0038856751 /DNA_START=271 /DNA_END=483 /DNA_ORIENTATION=-